jgi:hypothetical protein
MAVGRAVYVHYKQTDGSWYQAARLTTSDSRNDARLGEAVAIDGKGVRILAGAPGNRTSKGETSMGTTVRATPTAPCPLKPPICLCRRCVRIRSLRGGGVHVSPGGVGTRGITHATHRHQCR